MFTVPQTLNLRGNEEYDEVGREGNENQPPFERVHVISCAQVTSSTAKGGGEFSLDLRNPSVTVGRGTKLGSRVFASRASAEAAQVPIIILSRQVVSGEHTLVVIEALWRNARTVREQRQRKINCGKKKMPASGH